MSSAQQNPILNARILHSGSASRRRLVIPSRHADGDLYAALRGSEALARLSGPLHWGGLAPAPAS